MLIDILTILMLILYIFIGYKQGLSKTLMSVVVFAASAVLTSVLGGYVSKLTVSNITSDKLTVGIVTVLIMIGLYLAISFALNIVSKPILELFKLPLLRSIDGVLGAVLSILKWIVFIWIASVLLKILSPSIGESVYILSDKYLSSSTIFGFFYRGGFTEWIKTLVFS